MKLANVPSWVRKMLSPDIFFMTEPKGFWYPVTKAIIKNRANMIVMGRA